MRFSIGCPKAFESPWSHGRLAQPWQAMPACSIAQSCLALCQPVDGSPPGSSVHEILQARILEWATISFSNDQPRQRIKKQRHYFVNKGPSSQGYGFSSGHVWMWELDYKESWALKNWCFWTAVLEKTLENLLDCKEIKPVNPKENESWIFIGRTDAETETPLVWPPDWKNWLIGKDPDAGKDSTQEEKGMTEDDMVGCHHQQMDSEFQ